MSEPVKKIRARVQKTRHVFVHNDLSQAATYFADVIREKLAKGSRDAIMLDGMGCATMIAFTFEANVNFMGFELDKAGKLNNWKEMESFPKKLKKVFDVLGIPLEPNKRPQSSMEKMKGLRDILAHGKPAYVEYDKEEVGTHDELERWRSTELAGGWEPDCMPESVLEALEDLDALWKLMVQKSGLDIWDTMTTGEAGVTFIAEVDPSTPSTHPLPQK